MIFLERSLLYKNITSLLAGKVEKNRMLGELQLLNVAQEVASRSIVRVS